jgi:hypothetical protein
VATRQPESDEDERMDAAGSSGDDQEQLRRSRGRPPAAAGKARALHAAPPAGRGAPRRAALGGGHYVDASDDDEDMGEGGSGSGSESGSDGDDLAADDRPRRGPGRPRKQVPPPPPAKRGRGAPKAAAGGGSGGGSGAPGIAALLPAGLDEEMLRATWLQLPVKNRTGKDELLQGYRREFPRWRLLLRRGGRVGRGRRGRGLAAPASGAAAARAAPHPDAAPCVPPACPPPTHPHSRPRRQRFSLLFHGFGSKRALLEAFASEALTDGGVLAVRAHLPGVTAKAVLAAVASALGRKPGRSAGHDELLAAVQAEPAARRLYVIVHNVDGPGGWRARPAARRGAVGRRRAQGAGPGVRARGGSRAPVCASDRAVGVPATLPPAQACALRRSSCGSAAWRSAPTCTSSRRRTTSTPRSCGTRARRCASGAARGWGPGGGGTRAPTAAHGHRQREGAAATQQPPARRRRP